MREGLIEKSGIVAAETSRNGQTCKPTRSVVSLLHACALDTRTLINREEGRKKNTRTSCSNATQMFSTGRVGRIPIIGCSSFSSFPLSSCPHSFFPFVTFILSAHPVLLNCATTPVRAQISGFFFFFGFFKYHF